MSATQSKGVQNEAETDQELPASHNPRNDAIEAIALANAKAMQNELNEAGLETLADEQPSNTDTEQNRLIGNAELSSLKVKTKVNGVEEETSIAEIVKAYQKDSAASQRLEQATLKSRELDIRERELQAREQALSNINQEHQPSSDQDADVKNVVDAFYEGDTEKTVELLGKLVGRSNATQNAGTTDINQLTSAIKSKLSQDAEMEKFGNEFADIALDPFLASKADTYFDEAIQNGKSFGEALTEAGESTRAWLKEKAGVKDEVTAKRDEKLARKQDLDLVQGANTKQSMTFNQPTEENPSDIIKAMRKARGLPT